MFVSDFCNLYNLFQNNMFCRRNLLRSCSDIIKCVGSRHFSTPIKFTPILRCSNNSDDKFRNDQDIKNLLKEIKNDFKVEDEHKSVSKEEHEDSSEISNDLEKTKIDKILADIYGDESVGPQPPTPPPSFC